MTLWGRDPAAVERMARERENAAYLPGIALPATIRPTRRHRRGRRCRDGAARGAGAAAARGRQSAAGHAAPLVIAAKGLERATGLRLSEVVRAERPDAVVAALSGPSFALEVARGLPTAVTIASDDLARGTVGGGAAWPSQAFRPYPSDDLLGVELAGALKNVVAIAAGVTMGKGLGENARAALITRGLAELTRLALALGARRETLMGLAGPGRPAADGHQPDLAQHQLRLRTGQGAAGRTS